MVVLVACKNEEDPFKNDAHGAWRIWALSAWLAGSIKGISIATQKTKSSAHFGFRVEDFSLIFLLDPIQRIFFFYFQFGPPGA